MINQWGSLSFTCRFKYCLLFLLTLAALILTACSPADPQSTTAELETVPPAAAFGLDRTYIKISYGTSSQITAVCPPQEGSLLSFSLGDDSILKISQRGNTCNLTAIGFGETTLTAAYGDDTISVTVNIPFEEEKLCIVHEETQGAGDQDFPAIINTPLELKACLKYGFTEITDATLSYSLVDESAGTIDSKTGVFIPTKAGRSVITVTAAWASVEDITVKAQYHVSADTNLEGGLTDFVVDVSKGKDPVILQLTDTQIIDPGQSRYPDRIGSTRKLTDAELEQKCFGYIRRAVKKAKPDLIIITGDIVYGEFDDSGRITKKFVRFMDSLGIPWAPIFGNHDNETTMGVTWQCQQYENAKNCLFKRGFVTGNSNYSIGLRQDGRLVKVLYMMDSNGCRNAYSYSYLDSFPDYNEGERIKTTSGITEDQLQWLIESASRIDKLLDYPVSKFLATHIPPAELSTAEQQAGYAASGDPSGAYVIGTTVQSQNGDFGAKGEAFAAELFNTKGLWDALNEHGFDGVFFGHDHKNNLSILYDGIRLTYGLKTGAFDAHDDIGATKITVLESGNTFHVEHLYDQS